MAKAAERNSPYRGGSPTLFALFNEATRLGWSYARIAKVSGVSRSAVINWYAGRAAPSVVSLEAWAKAMGGYVSFTLPGRAMLDGDLLVGLDVVAKEKGLSATALAERAGYDRKTLAYGAPRFATMRDYGAALGLELVWRRV